MSTVDQLVQTYVEVRDRIKELETEHKAQLAPYRDALSQVEGMLHTMLNQQGAESIKTEHGTAYKAPWTKAKVIDWPKTLDFIIESGQYDLLERRVSKTVVEDLGDVPGVELERGIKVNVRRS
jgi:hypothetical protein